MTGPPRDRCSSHDLSRRRVLATAGVALSVSTSGCVRQARSAVNRDEIDQLSLTITTVPSDGDRESIQLARAIRAVLEDAGIAVSIEMRSEEEYLRSVLINHDFDLFVGPHPGGVDPGFLYEALYSQFAEQAGWQNPYGIVDLTLDEHLEAQREADDEERADTVAATLESLSALCPFVPICVPEEYRVVRTDRLEWTDDHLGTRLGYLGLEGDDDAEIRAAHTDPRLSENLNPLAVEYRDFSPILELVYDSLATLDGTDVEPWLATEWEFEDGSLVVDLREEVTFHDGKALTADDVAFTYRLLSDTTLGDAAFPAPSPVYAGQVAAIADIEAVDDHRLECSLEGGKPAAERALLVPILPEHVWRKRTEPATVPGVEIAEGTTEAVVTDNDSPVGSGPYRVAGRTAREHVTLERYDDHFTLTADALPGPTAQSIRFDIDPRSSSAIERVESGDADLTSRRVESYVIDELLESTGDDVAVRESPSWTFYQLGFNVRHAPCSNPQFRRVVAQLIDNAWLVEEVFDGYARPVAAPVTEEWTPEDLEWDDGHPVRPFLGTDGDLDVEAAKAAFEEAGFRYGDDGGLRVRR